MDQTREKERAERQKHWTSMVCFRVKELVQTERQERHSDTKRDNLLTSLVWWNCGKNSRLALCLNKHFLSESFLYVIFVKTLLRERNDAVWDVSAWKPTLSSWMLEFPIRISMHHPGRGFKTLPACSRRHFSSVENQHFFVPQGSPSRRRTAQTPWPDRQPGRRRTEPSRCTWSSSWCTSRGPAERGGRGEEEELRPPNTQEPRMLHVKDESVMMSCLPSYFQCYCCV